MIAEEVDDEDERRQQQKNSSSSRTGCPVDRPGRPDVHDVHKLSSVDRSVDRLKVPNSLSGTRSTGGRVGLVDRQSGSSEILLIQKSVYLRLLF